MRAPRISSAAVALLALALATTALAAPPELRFSEDGTFKIIQLTDLHFGSAGLRDRRTTRAQTAVLKAEKEGLGLALFTGDMVTGFMEPPVGRLALPGAWFKAQWRKVVGPVRKARVPYAVALGNHDRQADLSGRQILELDRRTSPDLSLTQLGPTNISGDSNYHLTILDSQGQAPAARVWVLDSGQKGCEGETDSWGCVGPDVLEWVRETAASLPEVPTQLAVMHIPPPQVLDVWMNSSTWGFKEEASACPMADSGAFEALKEVGVQLILFGHDHKNCFHGTLEGVRLAYGRKSGHGNYPYGPQDWAVGARVVQLRQGRSAADAETWIRTQDGQREDEEPTSEDAIAEEAQGACSPPTNVLSMLE